MIRRATEADIAAVMGIEKSSFNQPHWTEADFLSAMRSENALLARVLLVDEDAGQIRGMAVASAITSLFPVEAEIQNIAVAEAHRRRGVARDLMRGLLDWAKVQKVRVIRLEVRPSNAGAIRLYQELGFAEVGIRKAYYNNPVEDACLMELCLPLKAD